MSRVRLTARKHSAADQTPYPGNVNQPDRKDPAWDQYHTFEQRVNHELPDMRHDWQNDERDDVGFGIPEEWGKSPTVASVRVAATKAVRVAVLLLGDKVEDEVIEAQARDMMAMGPKALDRTIQRFGETQSLYAADEEKKEDEKDEEKKAADEKVDEKVEEDKEKKAVSESQFKTKIEQPGSDEQPKKAADDKDEKKDEKVEEKAKCAAEEENKDEKVEEEKKASDLKVVVAAVAEALKAALPDFIQKKVDEKKEKEKDEKKEGKKGADEEKDEKVVEDEKKDEKKAADESEKKDEKVVEEKEAPAEAKKAMGEFDIELSAGMEDEPAPDPEADERLASLFDDPFTAVQKAAETSGHKAEASQKKAGITKLGGQPRVASAQGAVQNISDIWQTAPDVAELFK